MFVRGSSTISSWRIDFHNKKVISRFCLRQNIVDIAGVCSFHLLFLCSYVLEDKPCLMITMSWGRAYSDFYISLCGKLNGRHLVNRQQKGYSFKNVFSFPKSFHVSLLDKACPIEESRKFLEFQLAFLKHRLFKMVSSKPTYFSQRFRRNFFFGYSFNVRWFNKKLCHRHP